MAGKDRRPADPVTGLDALEQQPERFGLFAALRLLECAHPDAPRLGRGRRPQDEPVRLGQLPSMRFAPGELASFRRGRPHQLRCLSFGMFGPSGPLPLHLTEYADERSRLAQDPGFAAFVDLFHHRLLSLFYRAWASAQPAVHGDRPDTDRFATYVGALVGAATPALRRSAPMEDLPRRHYAGRFGALARSAEGLEDILEGFFEVDCRVEQFQPGWLPIPAEERLSLGRRRGACLGRGANLGRRSWQCQYGIAICMGPMDRGLFDQFQPQGPALARLRALVRGYLGDEFQWEFRPVLRREQVPALRLARGVRLGWNSWLGRRRRDGDEVRVRSARWQQAPEPVPAAS